jgi:acyl carrier protein
MTDLNERLLRCLSAVFPVGTEKEIRAADLEVLGTDSLTGVTLVSLIYEEFGVEMDLDELLRLRTFDAIQDYLSEQNRLTSLPQ